MKNVEIHSSSTSSLKTILKEDANVSKHETIANQAALDNVQLTRSLPNILRSNNTRNRKQFSKIDTSSGEDGNTSLELNTTLSSVDLDMEANYNKTASPKSHHQRKQVHNPLDIQYDIPDCNNNNNKNKLQKINQLDTLNVPPSRQNTPTKKLKYNNKQKKRSLKKPKKTARKSSSRTKVSRKKPRILAAIPDHVIIPSMQNTKAMQNNNFLENDIRLQPVYNLDFLNRNVNVLNDVAIRPAEPNNVFYCNNNGCQCHEVCNVEKEYDINLNDVMYCKPAEEVDTPQPKTIQSDFTDYEFPTTENNTQRKSKDTYIGSNFLCESEILYSCSCANCMSHDTDIVFYDGPVSTSTSSDDTEAGLLTCDLYTSINDFYIDNYSHIFDDDLLDDMLDLEKTNLYCGDFGESSFTKENACTGNNNTTEIIESGGNVSSENQSESQNLQPCHLDGIRDTCAESYSIPFSELTYPSEAARMENVSFDKTDISSYLNSESSSTKENKIISQDETPIQNTTSTDASTSGSKRRAPKNKKDLYVIKCSQCGKYFNKKHQLWKHFTYCNFYTEQFHCHMCSKMYRHRSSLVSHLRSVHDIGHSVSHGRQEKFYICNKCNKSYVRFRAFQRHVLVHHD
ncbi:PREDICTED: uncharacterized protein LOC105453970 [Wasmannia auropunctata]|uniref:uncharacterized protein LOC105453970 n=1 Tax=Wasmannia auropunctata TaxID=64793 RepID=UPI0005EE4F9D|nr:PREDICTED: uncharacterized protein LOC105453970 [Wasmannia auropunctata]XP_011694579.1 PREDICTED: uncharacterized protein LOC105453970 [Wasmannia auropunctata]XP_011694580.1 PREDICTED: uncharacterized protein LOC105453970 [Wasmannia auropunctata]